MQLSRFLRTAEGWIVKMTLSDFRDDEACGKWPEIPRKKGKLLKKTKNMNERYSVIMDCLKSAEFFREDQDIGAETRDQCRDDPHYEFLNIRIVTFDF
jgi:hypothetical protein